MELWGLIPFVIFIGFSAIFMGSWVYKDAKSKNLKAGLWTFLALSGNNCSGLFLYLLFGRKNTTGFIVKHYGKYIIGFAISFTGVLLSFALVIYQLVTNGLL